MSSVSKKRYSKFQNQEGVQFSPSDKRIWCALMIPPRTELPITSCDSNCFYKNGILTIDQCLDFLDVNKNVKTISRHSETTEETLPLEQVDEEENPRPSSNKSKRLLLDEMIDDPINGDILKEIVFRENLIISLKKDEDEMQIDSRRYFLYKISLSYQF